MFQPVIHRSSWHYRVWRWTFQNMFWNKWIPSSYSICPYVHRTFWIGLLLLPSMVVLYAPLKLIVYNLLYKLILRPITKSDVVSSILIWLIVMFLIVHFGLEIFVPSVIVTVGIGVAIVLSAMGLIKLGEIARVGAGILWVLKGIGWIFKALWWVFAFIAIRPLMAYGEFSFEVMARYYITPELRLKDNEYRYLNKNQFLIKLWYWIPPFVPYIILFSLPVAVPREVFFYENDGATGNFYAVLIFFAVMTAFYAFALFGGRSKARKNAYVRHPELAPQKPPKKPSFYKTHVSRPLSAKVSAWVDRNWDPFRAWIRAKHEKVCPFVRFVD